MARTIKFKMKFGEIERQFNLRVIRVREESEFYSKLSEIADLDADKKADASLAIYIQAISDWSVTKGPDVSKFFAGLDPIDSERIAYAVITEYQRQLQPEIVF